MTTTTITAGEYFLIEGDMYDGNGNMYVETSHPVYAFQGISPGGGQQVGLFFAPPLKCSSLGDVNNIPEIERIGDQILIGKVNIISRIGAVITITDDNNGNQPIGTLNVATVVGPSAVTGNADYVTYTITGLLGNVSVFSNDELYVNYFNESGAAHQVVFTLDLALLPKDLLKLMMEVFLDIVLQTSLFKLVTWIILQVLNGC